MLEHEVSWKFPEVVALSTTCHQRPLTESWYDERPEIRFCSDVTSPARWGCDAGRSSRTSMSAIPYQPIDRHQNSAERCVVGFAQLEAPVSSYAWYMRPFDGCSNRFL